MERPYTRVLATAVMAGAVLSVVLLAARIYFAVSFDEPLQVQTSGWEQGPLYVLWRMLHGQDVYMDRFAAPFATTGYNWLFYAAYGAITKGVMAALSLPDPWLPTVARFITLAGIVIGVAVAYKSLATAFDARDGVLRVLCGGAAVFVMTGPLMGFFAFSARPDAWALVFEMAAAWAFWESWRRHGALTTGAVVAVAVLAMAAWSFKQMFVFALGGIGLFLLLKRQFKSLALLAGLNVCYWALVFALGGPVYLQNVLFLGYPMSHTLGHGWDVFMNFATKSTPGLAGAAILIVLWAAFPGVRRTLLDDDAWMFAAAGLFVSGVLVFILSLQDGSSEIYYLPVSYFLLFASLAGWRVLGDALTVKWFSAAFIAGWLALIVAVATVLAGARGVLSVQPTHAALSAAQRCLVPLKLPTPIYIAHPLLSLPWMVPGAEPFVLSYVYARERAVHGERFKQGGIGGLIEMRRFGSIVLQGETVPDTVDGAPLEGYGLSPNLCPGLSIFLRDDVKSR